MATDTSEWNLEKFVPFTEQLPRDQLKLKAKMQLNETEDVKEECLLQIKKLIRGVWKEKLKEALRSPVKIKFKECLKEKNILKHNVRCIATDEFFLRFLRSRKFHVKRSFEALQNYCKVRVGLHHLFYNLRPEALKSLLRKRVFGILPYRDHEGKLIFYIRSGIWKKDLCTDEEFTASLLVMINYLSEDENSNISGISSLTDESRFYLPDVFYIMRNIRTAGNFLCNCIPARYEYGHTINEPSHYRMFFKLIQPFLPTVKLLLHGKDREELFHYIPQAILPAEFGGSLDYSFDTDQLIQIMDSYLKKMKEEQRHFLNED